MKYHVEIVIDAEEDLFELYKYVLQNDSAEKAEYLFLEIRGSCERLAKLPQRGHVPPELRSIGVYDYHEIHFKPYRIIYQIIGNTVYVHRILDGRRELEDLLQQRLLRGS